MAITKYDKNREAFTKKFTITDDSELATVPACNCNSQALNLTTGKLWVKRVDGKWQKLGTNEVYPAEEG